ncbi:hypothetical protein NDU88_005955 [Pleurodeles waltl]|uniref:Uncharacterized protein n=1 Tax=Pleurodeles waltl TaxID=8319 RepID=A0AAV7TVT6_PLEWA|nr:hypothetical protein NDU88_005955 [Pleurodeles waltl]
MTHERLPTKAELGQHAVEAAAGMSNIDFRLDEQMKRCPKNAARFIVFVFGSLKSALLAADIPLRFTFK